MSPFQQRARRVDMSFPVVFREAGAAPVPGSCLNLSESGLLAVFDVALELWSHGVIEIVHGGETAAMEARVARVSECEAGLAFAIHGEREQGIVRGLLREAERGTQLVGRPPF